MNIFESIKSEKKMSFSHWRYRTLHWCFSEDADRPSQSNLPDFLYTHYCPLFHLTNLIIVLLPLIILAKITIGICTGLVKVVAFIRLREIAERIAKFCKGKAKPQSEPTEEYCKALALKEEKKILLKLMLTTSHEYEFEAFWDAFGRGCIYFQKEQAEQFYITRMPRIVAAKKSAAERKEKMRQRLIFWTNFSQVFLKWFFNILYVCLALLVSWVLWQVIPPGFFAVVNFIKFLMTFNPIPMFLFIGKMVGIFAAIAILLYGFWRSRVSRKCLDAIGSSVLAVSPPFALLGQWFVLPLKWISQTCANTTEFIRMFYRENCPPIVIVSDEDEIIAEVE